MSSEQEIKATVTIKGEVSMGYDPGLVMHYYVPNADMDETRKVLREAEFHEIDEPRAQFLQEIKATVRIQKEVSMSVGIDPRNIPMLEVDRMLYYLPGVDMDGTRVKLREAGFCPHPRNRNG